MPDENAIMRSMRKHSRKRMQMAEEAERRSMVAFQSGSFRDYWLGLGREAEKRVEAEYERIESEYRDIDSPSGAEPEANTARAASGSESANGVPTNGGDDPPEPTTEELPPTA